MLITTDGRTLAAKGFVEINLHLNAFKCATHAHTHIARYMVLPITRKYAKSLCDKFNKVPKRYADGKGERGGVANKMKINCATRKKSKDFQGAHTDKQPKNISSTSAGAAPLLFSPTLYPTSPPSPFLLHLCGFPQSGVFVGPHRVRKGFAPASSSRH